MGFESLVLRRPIGSPLNPHRPHGVGSERTAQSCFSNLRRWCCTSECWSTGGQILGPEWCTWSVVFVGWAWLSGDCCVRIEARWIPWIDLSREKWMDPCHWFPSSFPTSLGWSPESVFPSWQRRSHHARCWSVVRASGQVPECCSDQCSASSPKQQCFWLNVAFLGAAVVSGPSSAQEACLSSLLVRAWSTGRAWNTTAVACFDPCGYSVWSQRLSGRIWVTRSALTQRITPESTSATWKRL